MGVRIREASPPPPEPLKFSLRDGTPVMVEPGTPGYRVIAELLGDIAELKARLAGDGNGPDVQGK
jgi:hypothetical protein